MDSIEICICFTTYPLKILNTLQLYHLTIILSFIVSKRHTVYMAKNILIQLTYNNFLVGKIDNPANILIFSNKEDLKFLIILIDIKLKQHGQNFHLPFVHLIFLFFMISLKFWITSMNHVSIIRYLNECIKSTLQ